MRYLLLLAFAGAACSGAKAPATTPDPARGLRDLSKDDAELTAIAVAAARTIPPKSTSGATTLFSGVFVNGRKARLASDAVVRSTGFAATSSSRTPTPQCRLENVSTGQSRPAPCPASVSSYMPPTFTFDEVRATADSAYVGVTEAGQMAAKSSCLTLTRRAGTWTYLSSTVMADPRQCGK
jgi:hypothetical protein